MVGGGMIKEDENGGFFSKIILLFLEYFTFYCMQVECSACEIVFLRSSLLVAIEHPALRYSLHHLKKLENELVVDGELKYGRKRINCAPFLPLTLVHPFPIFLGVGEWFS